jgi:hypothetical protein
MMMDKNCFFTVCGTKYYYGMKPFEIDRIIKIVKEPDNEHDNEAIGAELPFIGKVGYVANSPNTVARGTYSAGRIYDLFDTEAYAQVLFVTHGSVICLLILPEGEEKNQKAVNGEIQKPRASYEKKEIGFHI